jgi:Transketolase
MDRPTSLLSWPTCIARCQTSYTSVLVIARRRLVRGLLLLAPSRPPSIISTSRQTLPQLPQTRRDGVALGAYVLSESESATVTLIGVGAELSFAVEVAEQLKVQNGITARVISFPCQRLFEKQSVDYKRNTLQRHRGIPAVVIEPYAPNGWERYADAGICMTRFGHSLPGKAAYKFFGYEISILTTKVVRYLERLREDELLRGEYVDL